MGNLSDTLDAGAFAAAREDDRGRKLEGSRVPAVVFRVLGEDGAPREVP